MWPWADCPFLRSEVEAFEPQTDQGIAFLFIRLPKHFVQLVDHALPVEYPA